MQDNASKACYESEGFRAHNYLSKVKEDSPRWGYKPKSKLTAVLDKAAEKTAWRTARTEPTIQPGTIGVVPWQLTLDFRPQADAELSEQQPALARLELAVNKRSEQAFINALQEVDWEDRQAREFARAIKLALNIGAPTAAQQIYNKGVARYPNHADLQRYARLFAPTRTATRTLPPNPTLTANREWLKSHRSEYRGQWIAIRNGELLETASSLEELIARVGDTTNVLLTRA